MEENLWSISIDPDESMREYVLLQLKVRAMRDMLFRSRIFNYLAAATPGPEGAGHDRQDLGAGPARPQGQEGAQVRPGDRRRPRHRPRRRLPADAAHLRQHRPGRPDPLAGADARPLHHRPRATPGSRSSPCRRRCRSTSRRRWSSDLRDEVGVAVDRVYLNGLYPERFSKAEAEQLAAPGRGRGRRGAGGGAGGALRARPGPLPARPAGPPAAPGRGAGQDPPLPLRARPRARGGAAAREEALLMPTLERHPRGQGDLHLRRLRRRRQDDHLGGDRDRDGGPGAEGLRADDRPGQAARRLARAEGARQRGAPGRPGAVRAAGGRDEGRAVGDDARRQGDLRRADRAPGARRGVARPRPRKPHLPADLQRPRRLPGVHGDGEAVRAAHRRRVRPARPRHAADPQRARLPRRAETADPVHRGPLAADLHEADRAGGEGRRARRLGRARRPQADRRLRPARRPGRVLQRLQRHGRRASRRGPNGSTSCSPTPTPASSSSAARRASRSTRPSTSTANWSRRNCPSAASSSTRSTTRPRSCAATVEDLPATLAEKLGDEDLARAGRGQLLRLPGAGRARRPQHRAPGRASCAPAA